MNFLNSIPPKIRSLRPERRFVIPILQGVIVMVIIAVLSWGFRIYTQYEIISHTVSAFENRLLSLEFELDALQRATKKNASCRK